MMRRDVYQAIADPTRRAIISLLAHKKTNLSGLNDKFDISQPAISRHIKVLSECGLVEITQEGRERFCEINYEPLVEVAHWIEPFRKEWESRFTQLDQLLLNLKNKENEK